MDKEPRNREDEEADELPPVDREACEAMESLEAYRDYLKESRGDNLTFGDY